MYLHEIRMHLCEWLCDQFLLSFKNYFILIILLQTFSAFTLWVLCSRATHKKWALSWKTNSSFQLRNLEPRISACAPSVSPTSPFFFFNIFLLLQCQRENSVRAEPLYKIQAVCWSPLLCREEASADWSTMSFYLLPRFHNLKCLCL